MPNRWVAVCVCCAVVSCGPGGVDPTDTVTQGIVPAAVADPPSNPTSTAKVTLGRQLFWDPVLSGNRDVACATCHHPDFAYSDGRATSIGVGGKGLGPARVLSATDPHQTKRNSQTVLNAAFNGLTRAGGAPNPATAPMFWDNRMVSLENQAGGPTTAVDEMLGSHFTEVSIWPELVARLEAIPEYVTGFTDAFGNDSISSKNIEAAIAAFERTLVDHDSSYDRFVAGDTTALSAAQRNGLNVLTQNGCTACHSGPMFSDYDLHRLGVPDTTGDATLSFRTASLRNVSRTGPYMHNGSLTSLDAVFNFYNRVNQNLDPQLRRVRAPRGPDANDVKAFFNALSDGTFDTNVPASVPSGLPVGGLVR